MENSITSQENSFPLEGSRDTSEGIIISIEPDLCWTPLGGELVLIPYRIWATQQDVAAVANSVRQTGMKTHVKDSLVLRCYGDEPGTGGGFISKTTGQTCTPKTWSETVFAEGRNVVRHNDEWWMNNKNTYGKLFYTKDLKNYDHTTEVVKASMIFDTAPTKEAAVDSDTSPQVNMRTALSSITAQDPAADQFKAIYPSSVPIDTQNVHLAASVTGTGVGTPGGAGNPLLFPALKGLSNILQFAITQIRNGNRTSNCNYVIGTYGQLAGNCPNGGQAHHVPPDFTMGLSEDSGRRDNKPGTRWNGMPTFEDMPAVCLEGQAGVRGTEHWAAQKFTDYNVSQLASPGPTEANPSALPKGTARLNDVLEKSKDATIYIIGEACRTMLNSVVRNAFYTHSNTLPNQLVRATPFRPLDDDVNKLLLPGYNQ